jgi:hypothetical protein
MVSHELASSLESSDVNSWNSDILKQSGRRASFGSMLQKDMWVPLLRSKLVLRALVECRSFVLIRQRMSPFKTSYASLRHHEKPF